MNNSYMVCRECAVRFASRQECEIHHGGEWHKYNIRRDLCKYDPISLKDFEILLASKENSKGDCPKASVYCNACRKTFSNQQSYENHSNSKQHKAKLLKEGIDEDKAFSLSNKKDSLIEDKTKDSSLGQTNVGKTNNQYLEDISRGFQPSNYEIEGRCHQTVSYSKLVKMKEMPTATNTDVSTLLKYMEKIPANCVEVEQTPSEMDIEEFEEVDSDEWDDEIDLEGLSVKQCLFCAKKFDSMESNLLHMGKFHSFQIPDIDYCTNIEELMEYLEVKVRFRIRCLYCNKLHTDLSSLQRHMEDKWHMRMKIEKILEYSDFYDYSSTYPDADEASLDDDVNLNVLVPDENFELVLPSGTVIGHRAMVQYCNRSSRIRALAVASTSNKACLKTLSGYYRSIGWKGASNAELLRRSKDIKVAAAARQKSYVKLGVKANKLQTYFRLQNPMCG